MATPIISVILSTYNGSKFISQTIDSVLAQDYDNFELIIINDASTDNGEDIILAYQNKDKRIIYIKNEVNRERSKSKNKGVNRAKGNYIAFIDDDDIWSDREKLRKQITFLEGHKDYGLIGTAALCINENNDEIGKIAWNSTNENIKNNLLLTNQFVQSSILMRKDIFLQAGGFPENLNVCEDYDLWLRVGQITNMANLKDFCTKYRIRKSSTTGKNQIKMKRISLQLIQKYKSIYPHASFALMMRLLSFFIPIGLLTKIRSLL